MPTRTTKAVLFVVGVTVVAAITACSTDASPPPASAGGAGGEATSEGGQAQASASDAASTGGHTPMDAAPQTGGMGPDAGMGTSPLSSLPTRSPGCGKPAVGTGAYMRESMQIANKPRANFVWVPANYDPNRAYALLFTLHGTGGVAPGDGKNIELSAGKDAIIMTPQAIGGTWQLGVAGEDVMFWDAMLQNALNAFCINPQRVFVMGFSRGGAMTNLLGCVRGDKVRGLGPQAGWQPAPQTACTGRPAARFVHGGQDGVVPVVQGYRSRDLQNARNGCEPTTDPKEPAPCVQQRGCMPGSPVVWCEIPGDHGAPVEWLVPATWQFFESL